MLEDCSQFCVLVCVGRACGGTFGTKGGLLGFISLLMVSGTVVSSGDNLNLSFHLVWFPF